MDLFGFFRKYVWNDEKTPYLTPVGRLTRAQAKNEIFIYCVLIAAFFLVVGMAALLGASIVAGSVPVAIYAFVLCCTAITLAATHHPVAAVVCATAAPVVLAFLVVQGFPPRLHMLDKILIAAVLIALFVYSFRVVRIARAFLSLDGPAEED